MNRANACPEEHEFLKQQVESRNGTKLEHEGHRECLHSQPVAWACSLKLMSFLRESSLRLLSPLAYCAVIVRHFRQMVTFGELQVIVDEANV